jgi:drug/metabolite transporter (DMT)-like permease
VLGHTVFNWTLRHLRAVIVSLAFLGEPPITALLAIPFLGEWPPRNAVAGGVAVLLGLGFALAEPSPVSVAEEAAAQ